MNRYVITFYDCERGKLGRYPYYDFEIGCVSLPEVLEVLRRSGQITQAERNQMYLNCKCIMIEEDS